MFAKSISLKILQGAFIGDIVDSGEFRGRSEKAMGGSEAGDPLEF